MVSAGSSIRIAAIRACGITVTRWDFTHTSSVSAPAPRNQAARIRPRCRSSSCAIASTSPLKPLPPKSPTYILPGPRMFSGLLSRKERTRDTTDFKGVAATISGKHPHPERCRFSGQTLLLIRCTCRTRLISNSTSNPSAPSHRRALPVVPDTSASCGLRTPPAASQNSDETMAAKIASRTRHIETAARTPPRAAFSPLVPCDGNGERNHFGRRDNAATAKRKTRRNSLRGLSAIDMRQPPVGGDDQQQYQ